MIATSETHTELVIKEAVRDDSGTYDLVLENKCGKKAVYIKVRVIGSPNAPEGPLEYDDIQARSVRVSWRPPADDGGADILGYILERREVPKAAWYTIDSRVRGTSLVVKGLKENVEYHFRVSAENQFGISKPLKSEEPVIPKTPLSKYSSNHNTVKILSVLFCFEIKAVSLQDLGLCSNTCLFSTCISRSSRASKQSSRNPRCDQEFRQPVLVPTQRRWWVSSHRLLHRTQGDIYRQVGQAQQDSDNDHHVHCHGACS